MGNMSWVKKSMSLAESYSGGSIFTSRLVCGVCGGYYGQKVWHSNDPYRKVIWRCNRKYGKGQRCNAPTLNEETIKALFLKAYNLLMADREIVAEDCRVAANLLSDTGALDDKIQATKKEMEEVVALNSAFIHSHNASGDNMEEFKKKTAEYDERYKKAEVKLDRLQTERQERLARSEAILRFIDDMLEQPLILEQWEEQPWNMLVQKAVISADGSVAFTFKGEKTITVRIE